MGQDKSADGVGSRVMAVVQRAHLVNASIENYRTVEGVLRFRLTKFKLGHYRTPRKQAGSNTGPSPLSLDEAFSSVSSSG
jgi:hypothetical protein